jgi:lipopolysaccharide/colanic/teichoic acid biosynthesis glycosyltransferase/CTP:molybdopterin cytidylyltransferase MocA
MKAIILAASPDGVGLHLHESLWPLLGRPLIDRQLEALGELGAREVWVSLRHRPFGLDRHLQRRSIPPLTVVRLERYDRGILGTLAKARRFITETTLLWPADMVPPADLGEHVAAHMASDARCTEIRDDAGNTCYLLEPELLAALAEEGPLCPESLAQAGQTVRRVQHPGLARLGTPEGFLAAHAQELSAGAIHPTARVHPSAKVADRVWIGPGCRVEREAVLAEGTILLEGSRVERGAKLSGVVLLPHVRVGKAARFSHAILTSEGSFGEGGFKPEFDPEVLGSTRREGWGERLHQGLDMTLAGTALLVLAPLLLVLALCIRLDSPGPIFYSQLRVGQDRRGRLRGRVFELYKFRTMHVDADARLAELKAQNAYGSGPFFKLSHDPRITRLGQFLRKTSLDELPQLLNVLKGDMRLVGNRPLPVYEAEELAEEWQRMRFNCPAGITGLWQISGRSDLSEHERMVLDTVYAVTRSFWSDWAILLKTLPALLLRRGAR